MTSPAAVSAGKPGTLGSRPGGRRPAGVVVRALIALTKPRIIELLLVTTVPTMLLAQRGVPSIRLVLVTLIPESPAVRRVVDAALTLVATRRETGALAP